MIPCFRRGRHVFEKVNHLARFIDAAKFCGARIQVVSPDSTLHVILLPSRSTFFSSLPLLFTLPSQGHEWILMD